MYSDEWICVHGVARHYQDWGSRETPSLLLLHGLTQQSHAFDGAATRLAGRFRGIALDVRGRGEPEALAAVDGFYGGLVTRA